jgi:hypothetical protein
MPVSGLTLLIRTQYVVVAKFAIVPESHALAVDYVVGTTAFRLMFFAR